MTSPIGFTIDLPLPYDEAIARTRDALKAEGFGILTEIDVRSTFREKLDVDFRPYLILGACNPPLAHAALTADASVGLLLPCNVTVEASDGGGSTVRLTDPVALLQGLAAGPELRKVAEDARGRMVRVREALAASRV
ncbi:MAG TPA: DUF302 domain-containing protein [Gemmatimonadaceae bacterium]